MIVRIAWIEDDTPIIDPVVFLIERAGYQVHRYVSFADAIGNKDAILGSDLILLDIIIPNDGPALSATPYLGLVLVEELYSVSIKEGRSFPPVLILSAVSRERVVRDFKDKYSDKIKLQHLRKPVLPSILKERVDQILADAKGG
ncbi:MAG: hypothetical protein U0R19_32240 [Bryobacteraceae bacterium]